MADDDFPGILKELDRLCGSSKYVRVFTDPNPFLHVLEDAFSALTKETIQIPEDKIDIEPGLAQSLLQKLIGDCYKPNEGEASDVITSKISSTLLSSCVSRVREVEADYSLAHVIPSQPLFIFLYLNILFYVIMLLFHYYSYNDC